MANKPNRYKLMERYMTIILSIDTIAFILYMIFAGLGVIWLKALLAIGCLMLSGYLLWILYVSKELHRPKQPPPRVVNPSGRFTDRIFLQ